MSLLRKTKMGAKSSGSGTVRDAGRLSQLASGAIIENVVSGGTMRARTVTIGAEEAAEYALDVRQNVREMCLWESERLGRMEEQAQAAIGAARRTETRRTRTKRKMSEGAG